MPCFDRNGDHSQSNLPNSEIDMGRSQMAEGSQMRYNEGIKMCS